MVMWSWSGEVVLRALNALALRIDQQPVAGRLRRVDWDWALSTRPGIVRMELPDATMRIRIARGGSRTVVFAADPPIVAEHYDELISLLVPDASVVCLELPGFGFSLAKSTFPFTFAAYADAVARTLVELDC